jgi:phenylacetate-CoA ligase
METASIKQLENLRMKLIKWQVNRTYNISQFYRCKFKKNHFHPSQLKNLDDIKKVPFTTREELEVSFKEILCVPFSQVATIRQTSGTTGIPLTVAHSKKDLETVAEAYARKLTYHGVTKRDVIQITTPYGLWQGAWSIHSGAEKIGACILPVGPGDTERQVRIIKNFNTTVLYAVTNYHLRIAEIAKQMGEDLGHSSLRVGICVGERPTEQQTRILKKELGYETVVVDYGATEFPGFCVNCRTDHKFHHVWADYHLVEVVDPDTKELLPEGERGELVITTLQRESFPLIRYLTRDITCYEGFSNCDCGSNHPKINADIDRKDFMIKVRGTPVFPSRVEYILSGFEGITGRNQIIVDKRTPRQELILKAELERELSKLNAELLKEEIQRKIKRDIGITVNEILFVPFGVFDDKLVKTVVMQ